MKSPNDELFDRFEALTFDDVVIVPGYSETLPDSVDTTATFAAGTLAAAAMTGMALSAVLDENVLGRGVEAGYLTWQDGRLAATVEGRLRLDALLGALVG